MRGAGLALIALALVVGSACGGTGSDMPASDATPRPDAPPMACEPVTGEPALALERVADGFTKPVFAGTPPGDPRIFVLEQHTGLAKIVVDGQVRAQPFLDLGDEVARGYEQGLLSLAFHPDYATNGRFFVGFTRDDDALVVEEWRVSDDPDRADPDRRRQLLLLEKDTNFHHGGRAAFGPDGHLYLGTGDGGPQHDPNGHAQDLGVLFGKFLRLDVDRGDGERPYGIPPDNPFVDLPDARPEIYVYGVRNPWGWSIDPATGHLYFGDVGLARWEEIDVIPVDGAGANYGWPVLMGNECEEDGCDPTGYTPPLATYAYAVGERCSVIGGHVYRGCRMPGHHGRYFFSDFCAAFVRSFRWSQLDPDLVEITEHAEISDVLAYVSGIGLDVNGELLLLDWEGGTIQRVVPAP